MADRRGSLALRSGLVALSGSLCLGIACHVLVALEARPGHEPSSTGIARGDEARTIALPEFPVEPAESSPVRAPDRPESTRTPCVGGAVGVLAENTVSPRIVTSVVLNESEE